MKDTKKKDKVVKRKLFFLIAYIIIIPVFVISALFITTYTKNKIKPYDALITSTTTSYTEVKSLDSFDFDFYCTKYNYTASGTSNRSMEFKAAISNQKNKGHHSVDNVKMNVVMGSNWNGYLSGTSGSKTLSFSSTSTPSYVTATISNYTLNYPSRVLLFINIEAPNTYVLLTWSETVNGGGATTYKMYKAKYTYDQYFKNGTTILG